MKGGKEMEEVIVDVEKIRHDLMDYFGTSHMPFKMVAVARVESATPDEVIELALDEDFDLDKYAI